MSEPELWIEVRNWNKFQHYKDRNPPWVKNYIKLLHDENYLSLPPGTRAILHGLWLEYAASEQKIPLSTRIISARLRCKVTIRQLEALNHAGFIRFRASTTRARGETERALSQKPATANAVVQYEAGRQIFESTEDPWPLGTRFTQTP